MRDFSSRYVFMYAPCIRPDAENCSVRNLPKRDELLFLRGRDGTSM